MGQDGTGWDRMQERCLVLEEERDAQMPRMTGNRDDGEKQT